MFYYKSKNTNAYLAVKEPLNSNDYIEITKKQYESFVKSNTHTFTKAEKERIEKRKQIAGLKDFLTRTDYVVIKIAEGVATAEEYANVLVERANARSTINTLESEL